MNLPRQQHAPDESPERRSTRARSREKLRFLVQRQGTEALHFDLRLELDGVLKSWAIPRGPSDDPAERRLAVHTEDQPIDDAAFEAGISEGEFASGAVRTWDEGTWIPEGPPITAYRRGHLRFQLKGHRLKGHWSLVRTGNAQTRKKDLWLLVKRAANPRRRAARG